MTTVHLSILFFNFYYFADNGNNNALTVVGLLVTRRGRKASGLTFPWSIILVTLSIHRLHAVFFIFASFFVELLHVSSSCEKWFRFWKQALLLPKRRLCCPTTQHQGSVASCTPLHLILFYCPGISIENRS